MKSGRIDYLSWDDYFMNIALNAARKSKDPSTQVGACIVDGLNRVVGTGYNGFPRGVDDSKLPWDSEGSFLEIKNSYVSHAEKNAIGNSTVDLLVLSNMDFLNGNVMRIYSTYHPCNKCAIDILQAGIKEVIYLSNKGKDKDEWVAARRLFELGGVNTRQHIPDENVVRRDYDFIIGEIRKARDSR